MLSHVCVLSCARAAEDDGVHPFPVGRAARGGRAVGRDCVGRRHRSPGARVVEQEGSSCSSSPLFRRHFTRRCFIHGRRCKRSGAFIAPSGGRTAAADAAAAATTCVELSCAESHTRAPAEARRHVPTELEGRRHSRGSCIRKSVLYHQSSWLAHLAISSPHVRDTSN
jgi:hypothetical protein